MSGPLNLSDADLAGFEPLEPGRYNAEVFEITMDAVKNTSGTGKMPAGTPMVKVQFKLTNNEIESLENRRVFTQFVIPPPEYDKAKASKMKGMLARFFIATGDAEEVVLGEHFDPDFEDYKGRPVVVVLGKEPRKDREGNTVDGEWNNPVKGIKPAGSIVTGASSGLL
jgi:hypothetical protein